MKEISPGEWVPDFTNRYFTEDIPEGFCMYKGIADLAGVETPTIDLILGFFQNFMGKEYLKDGKLQHQVGVKSLNYMKARLSL